MILFPNCKINIGLNIVRKRADGYHDLESIFYPLPIKDIIEIIPSSDFQFKISGLDIPGNTEDNLCVKAYRLIKKDFPDLPPVYMHLHKNIPIGSGLGGGSADGAFMLQLINETFQLGLLTGQLMRYALQLGSDCPFFVINKPCFVSGTGGLIQKTSIDLSSYSFAVIHPGIHIKTSWAFSNISPALPSKKITEIVQQPISSWRSELVNDFENIVFATHPVLKDIKEKLYEAGAWYAGMSGSGSSIYGIFKKTDIPPLGFEKKFRVDIIN